MKIALVIVYIILTVSGLVFMKLGGNSGQIAVNEGIFHFNISLVSALGFLCYLCSFLLFTQMIQMFNLSYIIPISTGIVQILTLVAANVIFKENMSLTAIIGASLIIIGIIVMNWRS